MLTQAQLGAAEAQNGYGNQNSLLAGFLGRVFMWACVVMVATSYCSSKVHEYGADKRQAHPQTQVQKPARAAKLPASAVRAAEHTRARLKAAQ